MSKIGCGQCGECLERRPEKCILNARVNPKAKVRLQKGDPDWTSKCVACGASPTVYTGQGNDCCGPCTFGEAETAGGNW